MEPPQAQPRMGFELPPLQELALVHARGAVGDALAAALALDQRCARIVLAAKEPILAQMRLAWWRDQLGMEVADRPRGDPVLDALGLTMGDLEESLIALVDGWEVLFGEEEWSQAARRACADGRAEGVGAIASVAGLEEFRSALVSEAGRWALADLALLAPEAGTDAPPDAPASRLPRPLRAVSIMRAVAERCVVDGGRAPLSKRGDALLALRVALLGR